MFKKLWYRIVYMTPRYMSVKDIKQRIENSKNNMPILESTLIIMNIDYYQLGGAIFIKLKDKENNDLIINFLNKYNYYWYKNGKPWMACRENHKIDYSGVCVIYDIGFIKNKGNYIDYYWG